MINLPDIDRQTIAGATATSTHGTGLKFPSLSGFVKEIRMATAGATLWILMQKTILTFLMQPGLV